MRFAAVLFILCAAAEIRPNFGKDSCAAVDTESDNCALLQGGAFLNQHSSDVAPHSHLESRGGEKGFPGFDDLVKKATAAVNSFGDLEKAFEAVKAKVLEFISQGMEIAKRLGKEITASTKVSEISAKVTAAFVELKQKAGELGDAIHEASKQFSSSLSTSALPKEITSEISTQVGEMEKEAQSLSKQYETCSTKLAGAKISNASDICPVMKSSLEKLKEQGDALVEKASALTWDKLKAKVEAVMEKLPDSIKEKVDGVMEKVSSGADELVKSLPTTLNEVNAAIAKALKGTCDDLPVFESGALRVEFSAMAAVVCAIGFLSF